MIINPQQLKTSVQTAEQADGSLIVQIDQTAYVVRSPITDDGLKLTHICSIALTPLVSAAAPAAFAAAQNGKNTIEAFMPDIDDIVMGLGQGMETMSPEQFIGLVKLCLGSISLKVQPGPGNPLGEVPALPLYDTHFRVNFSHLGILTAYAIARGGVVHFFGGLATLMSSLFPAQKSQSISQKDSDGSTGSSSNSPLTPGSTPTP